MPSLKLFVCTLQALVAAWVLFAPAVSARDIYVDNLAGDDLSTGLSPDPGSTEGPTRTIAKALRLAGPSDRIILARTEQPYRETISLVGNRHSGTLEQPFIIEGNDATLSGAARVPVNAWKHYRDTVFYFPLTELQHQQLFLEGKPARRFVPSPQEPSLMNMRPLEWTLARGALFFRVETDRLPHQYPASYAKLQTGITLYQVQYVVIVDLVVEGYHIDGVQVHDSRGPCLLAGMTCRGNGRSGIAVVGASEAAIDASLVGDNGESQLHLEGPADVRVTNSELLEAAAPKWRRKNGRLMFDGQLIE